jgi:hypothetical protein
MEIIYYINESDVARRFKNLVSTSQLVKKIAQHGYQGAYTEQAIYILLDKYGITPKAKRGGKSYFNKRNACTCIDRHIFELREIAEELEYQNQEEPDWNVGYGRDDMSVTSREQLADDGVFGADENELYSYDDDDEFTNESIFSFKQIVNEMLDEAGFQRADFMVLRQYPRPADISNVTKPDPAEKTKHWNKDRKSRLEKVLEICNGDLGNPVYSFLVDEAHNDGKEIHTLTDKCVLIIQNEVTKNFVTLWLPWPGKVKRYWFKRGSRLPIDPVFDKIMGLSEYFQERRIRV